MNRLTRFKTINDKLYECNAVRRSEDSAFRTIEKWLETGHCERGDHPRIRKVWSLHFNASVWAVYLEVK